MSRTFRRTAYSSYNWVEVWYEPTQFSYMGLFEEDPWRQAKQTAKSRHQHTDVDKARKAGRAWFHSDHGPTFRHFETWGRRYYHSRLRRAFKNYLHYAYDEDTKANPPAYKKYASYNFY